LFTFEKDAVDENSHSDENSFLICRCIFGEINDKSVSVGEDLLHSDQSQATVVRERQARKRSGRQSSVLTVPNDFGFFMIMPKYGASPLVFPASAGKMRKLSLQHPLPQGFPSAQQLTQHPPQQVGGWTKYNWFPVWSNTFNDGTQNQHVCKKSDEWGIVR
jgi:hypothetical protein